MRKKGIITIWAIMLVVILSYVMSNMDKNQNYAFWLSSMKEKELSYHHLVTIEDWAKKIIKSGYKEPVKLIVSKDKLSLNAVLTISDGKININSLAGIIENNWKYSIFTDMFKWFFPDNYVKKLNIVIAKLEMGKGQEAMQELGNISELFIDRKLVSQLFNQKQLIRNTDRNPYFNEVDMININEISPLLAAQLMRMDIKDVAHVIEANNNKTDKTIAKNPYPQFMQSFWKVNSLFYEVKGHIIVNNRRQDFIIHLNKEGNIVKTTKRKMF